MYVVKITFANRQIALFFDWDQDLKSIPLGFSLMKNKE
jgi:hypothetical protein